MSAQESAAMERARLVLHDWIECSHDDDCRDMRRLLTLVGDARAHDEAEKLRKIAASMKLDLLDPFSPYAHQLVTDIANSIDPYEMRGDQLVRKSDGKPVTL